MDQVFLFLVPFMPLMATLPAAVAAVWIANRWLKTRGTSAEILAEVAGLREEMEAVRQAQAELQDRFDFSERLIAQLRDGPQKSLNPPQR
ncbi:MAG: hypothetical protein ABJD11_04340 [Gemmatimonadota bacterium]